MSWTFVNMCEISKDIDIAHNILNTYTTEYAFYKVLKVGRITMS